MILVRPPLGNPMEYLRTTPLLLLTTLIPRVLALPLVTTLSTIRPLNLSINLRLATYRRVKLMQLASIPPAATNFRIPLPHMNITHISSILGPINPMHNYTHQIQTISQ